MVRVWSANFTGERLREQDLRILRFCAELGDLCAEVARDFCELGELEKSRNLRNGGLFENLADSGFLTDYGLRTGWDPGILGFLGFCWRSQESGNLADLAGRRDLAGSWLGDLLGGHFWRAGGPVSSSQGAVLAL